MNPDTVKKLNSMMDRYGDLDVSRPVIPAPKRSSDPRIAPPKQAPFKEPERPAAPTVPALNVETFDPNSSGAKVAKTRERQLLKILGRHPDLKERYLRDGEYGCKVFDWNAALADAKAEKWSPFDRRVEVLGELASDWPTCACGNLCASLPRETRYGSSMPSDEKLADLGFDFPGAVCEAHWDDAQKIMGKIEKRSVELLMKEMKKHGRNAS